ncbi:Putative auxiliary Activity family 9 [Colletotrichum destructivum]|uniref:Auxiliary Activity family 9 n=1 Tax=Colletotrichum destructivum TaxID=34406 RepID=A0AAX4IP48_9PEZI|nr:Putative auxiliary Activity family 9 [Colletotrichum destructivum]
MALKTNQLLFLASMLASATLGHVVLENPKPFKFVADGPTNPISTSGSDFPCKIPPWASYEIDGSPTAVAIGETLEATFKGQAVHGGGSCQFALSADTNPTKASKWMVIHSIEGGCPARNQKGNLEGHNADKYPFKIPAGIAPGDYVFAWIWLARVGGQPEYYMNCAPITVTGAKKSKMKKTRRQFVDRRASLARREQFPELFMANIGEVAGGCTTGKALNARIPIAFPNPGIYVDHPEGAENLYKQPCDGNPRAGSPAEPGPGVGSPSSPAGTAAPTPTVVDGTVVPTASSVFLSSTFSSSDMLGTKPVSTNSPTTMSAEPSLPTGLCPAPIISTVTNEITVTVTATIISISVTGSQLVGRPTAAPTASPTASPGAPEPAPVNCTEGHLTCLPDETHFATCTGGKLTAPQPIAPGFKCTAGEGEGLDISPIVPYF